MRARRTRRVQQFILDQIARDTGMAKPTPWNAPELEEIAVLLPTTLPSKSIKGPA